MTFNDQIEKWECLMEYRRSLRLEEDDEEEDEEWGVSYDRCLECDCDGCCYYDECNYPMKTMMNKIGRVATLCGMTAQLRDDSESI